MAKSSASTHISPFNKYLELVNRFDYVGGPSVFAILANQPEVIIFRRDPVELAQLVTGNLCFRLHHASQHFIAHRARTGLREHFEVFPPRIAVSELDRQLRSLVEYPVVKAVGAGGSVVL